MIQTSQIHPQEEGEISLIDILRFLNSAHKTILIFGLIGILAAIVYLAITPKQYEATALIRMVQIGAANNNNNNFNPLGTNVEEPALLIARLSMPSSFTPESIVACGLQDQIQNPADAPLRLSKMIKLSVPKSVANIVELKTTGASPQLAWACASAIFDLIKATQAQIVAPYIQEARIKLADDEVRLEKVKTLASRADKSGSAMGTMYLYSRDEIHYLLDEITSLKNVVISNQIRITHLVAPIYASDQPISPKKWIALAGGLFGGLFLGILIALARQMIPKLKAQLRGAG